MSHLLAVPEFFTSAASDVAGIGSTLNAATAAAAAPTTQVLAAANDEVSVALASLFGGYGDTFQQFSTQAAAYHAQFMHALSRSGNAYALADAVSTSQLQTIGDDILAVINTPTNVLLGTPLIGNGTNGAVGTGQN